MRDPAGSAARAVLVRAARLSAVLAVLVTPVRAAGPAEAKAWLAAIERSPDLQKKLDAAVDALLARNPQLRPENVRLSVIDLDPSGRPKIADRNGDRPTYPASVVKFVYLMAAFAWKDQEKLEIDATLDRDLREMTYASSNDATQRVVARLTGTSPGPELSPEAYREFRDRRLMVKRWLATLGIEQLHAMHPTYNGNGDLYGRDRQLLQDGSIPGGLPAKPGEYPNRQAMTANETARLLALLATDRALSPASSAEVRERMRRDSRKQPHLVHRIAGGARRCDASLEIVAKTGTWGPIYADAGFVRNAAGDSFVLAAFIDSKPPYRGSFIADLTLRLSQELLGCDGAAR
ncbi:MAG: hypothetical protein FJ144_22070 [Deltaproteobacteria bacterium]|nr:hypothetical protein [Deltaproteobacteria bacterium]